MSKSSITLSLTDKQKQLWQKWADTKGMNMSAFIRHCVGVCISVYEKKSK